MPGQCNAGPHKVCRRIPMLYRLEYDGKPAVQSRVHSPEGGAKGDVAHEDDIQQDERSGEEPVHIASIVDAAQVAVRVCNVHAATVSALQRVLGVLLYHCTGQCLAIDRALRTIMHAACALCPRRFT